MNDVIVEEWLAADPRDCCASIAIYPNDPELAVRDFHPLGDRAGPSDHAQFGADAHGQRYYHPIYAAATEHGLPVAIHPGTERRRHLWRAH